jgi:hypothetical protein
MNSPLKPGRPKLPAGQIKNRSGFTRAQCDRIRAEAMSRSLAQAAIVREMAEFYFAALDHSRGVVSPVQEEQQ